ncbi:ROK family transcriptional regulator [Streptacidiphilus jiangxiensis]|uniref:Sugar kinase of the NBD/HSP70 family, may contain an N-terminal HTH domain n=1 Tax=Streptacidiphilus jiangxiensis TaxID=235985 RepID=A0A1H7R9N1_STRJI|nr:ROK family transcriptional regulator [Streptacidiphilus jiangxiensis]SEL56976.1 Sugar kinase of the NBD/HSP70 family, may contain an N-terminal HTH domain [Streptacidiphilus jiangxiensis]
MSGSSTSSGDPTSVTTGPGGTSTGSPPSTAAGRVTLPGANLTALRDHNAATVLSLVRAASTGGAAEHADGAGQTTDAAGQTEAVGGTGISRVELARESGLTAQAISKIVQRLTEDGLLAETGRGASTGGKPRTLLSLVPDARWAVGVQLGRDELTVLRADLAGRVMAARHVPIDLAGWGPRPVLDLLGEQVDLLLGALPRDRVLGVGIASPGPLDQRGGVLHDVTGAPSWTGLPLRDEVERRLGLPTLIEKDSTAGVLSALGSPNRAFVHLDRGLGAGLVLGGAVQRGARTNAGEFGHQMLDPTGPRCRCGNAGCVEALWAAAPTPTAAARVLGEAIANLVRLLDLDEIVLGGREVLAAPDLYLTEIRGSLAARLPDPAWQTVTLSVAPSGPDAVALGAAGLVLTRLFG